MRPGCSSFRPGVSLTAAFATAVFALTLLLPASALGQTVTTLENFNGHNGANPFLEALVQGRDGNLYGTTYSGGANSLGTVFRFNRADNHIAVIHSFAGNDDGSFPSGGLVLDTDGNYYGTTDYGGSAGFGVLFKISSTGAYTLLHSFLGGSDGEYPAAAPIQADDGNLYGTTNGGQGILATVYKFTRDGVYSVIYTFDPETGAGVYGLLQASNSRLYATAEGGGAGDCGSIVELTLAGVAKEIHSFNCEHDGGGAYPVAALIQGANGNFYGTTSVGGASDFGVVFEMGPGLGEIEHYGFTSAGPRNPQGGLVQGTDGNLYGVSQSSGNLEGGMLYSWNPSTLALTELYQFTGVGYLTPTLMQHTSGLFYGPSWQNGTHNDGFIYSVNMGLGPFVAFVHPVGLVGGTVEILGQGLTGATGVSFNGVAATSFTVVSDTYMTAVVPTGATSGTVVVSAPGGTPTSNVSFRVTP